MKKGEGARRKAAADPDPEPTRPTTTVRIGPPIEFSMCPDLQRLLLAGCALAGLLGNGHLPEDLSLDEVAEAAWRWADRMLATREKGGGR